MKVRTRRIHQDDGSGACRILVDGLWPRGVSREQARLDAWWRDIAPSDDLRRWFGHDPERWPEFRRRYLHELAAHKGEIKQRLSGIDTDELVLLYAARDQVHNHARVLKEYLEQLEIR